jgi:hypothetical protein
LAQQLFIFGIAFGRWPRVRAVIAFLWRPADELVSLSTT